MRERVHGKGEVPEEFYAIDGVSSQAIVTFAVLSADRKLKAQGPAEQQGNSAHAKTRIEHAPLEDAEERLGPVSIGGRNIAVVLHEKRLPGAQDPRFAQTLATLEVHDDTDAVLYQKPFPYEVEGEKFRRSVTASARLLTGKYFTG